MAKSSRPLVLLTWHDAHSPGATDVINPEDLTKVHGSMPIVTVGWVLRDDHDGVTIAGEWCGDDDYRNGTFVPRGMVVKMDPIVKPRKRPGKATSPSFDEGITPTH